MQNDNKKIVKNTIVNYIGLFVNTVLGVLIARYVLMALGASDYGLYGVVGGFIAMLNFLSTAMTTTTRRYINVEMGKKDGSLNKIFNICMVIHIGFALFILLVAETVGIFYINNYLNVAPGKLADAHFVFQVSTIAAAIGITNVPYQALVEAYERFDISVGINVFNTLLKLLLSISLISYTGNTLRVYAIGISLLTLVLFVFFRIVCVKLWKEIVQFKFYRGRKLYWEILVFNNYTAIGAFAYTGRIQGSQMIVNYFFGTLVNAAFQIAYTIENYCTLFVSNVGRAAWPQITQSFSGGNYERTIRLTECMAKYTILLTLLITVPVFAEMDFILSLWLKNVPEGAVFLCKITLVDALVKSLCGGTDALIQASGKVKWFQIVGSSISIMTLPVAFFCYKFGFSQETIIYLYIISSIIIRLVSFILLKVLIGFDIYQYVKNVYYPSIAIIVLIVFYLFFYSRISVNSYLFHFCGILVSILIVLVLCYIVGLNKVERNLIVDIVSKKTRKR